MNLTLTDLLLEDDGFSDHQFHNLQAPSPGDPGLKAWLEKTFGNEPAYGGSNPGDGPSTLGNGGDWATCTSWADMVAAAIACQRDYNHRVNMSIDQVIWSLIRPGDNLIERG